MTKNSIGQGPISNKIWCISLIENPSEEEKEILSKFSYKENLAIIHTDDTVMPRNKKVWSSWNSSIDPNNLNVNTLTYWLNLLQNLKTNKNIFLTLNPLNPISDDKSSDILIFFKSNFIFLFKKLCWNKIHIETEIKATKEYVYKEVKKDKIKYVTKITRK